MRKGGHTVQCVPVSKVGQGRSAWLGHIHCRHTCELMCTEGEPGPIFI